MDDQDHGSVGAQDMDMDEQNDGSLVGSDMDSGMDEHDDGSDEHSEIGDCMKDIAAAIDAREDVLSSWKNFSSWLWTTGHYTVWAMWTKTRCMTASSN